MTNKENVRAACVSLIFVIVAAGALLIFGRVPSWAVRNSDASPKLELNRAWTGKLDTGEWHAPALDPSRLYSLSASIDAASLRADSRYWIGLEGPGGLLLGKTLHAGDPSLYVTFRPRAAGPVTLRRKIETDPPAARKQFPSVRLLLQKLELEPAGQSAIEAEPNDSWQTANPLVPGRTIFGGTDDIEYLDNQQEYEVGWDWFRIDFDQSTEKLVYFELDLPDRDIPLQLLFHRYNPASNSIEPYTRGKDPMEVLHDGQKVRYSKFISRVLTKGRYYLAILGNHPAWQLRTTVYPVPPFKDAKPAVETAMHYMANIGDAWFAQIPRLGSRHRRSVMLHDEAARCTACHPTVFPLESNLTAFAKGYPIRAKSQFSYLMERVKHAPTPLYGNPGVTWVRFVGILLQFFGKQGGLLIDYEKHVTGQPTPLLNRFTGFLQATWDHREDLPADENNGVAPLDSKFGFAWRDWRVLDEMARRTGSATARASADHIESILAGAGSLKRIEGTQDRLHRVHAFALMNPKRYGSEIEKEMRYILARQNEDGGWPANEEKSASSNPPARANDSVEYLTGQTIHTFLVAGADNQHRASLEKGARWLLGRQQGFGGWFQTETIENFVTPMRETRYAIMALASMYPQPGSPRGLGNRDGKPARLPRKGALLETLDDLDNLWQVPEQRRAEFVAHIVPLLQHENPWVRALAAQCLGRIGDHAAAQPLLSKLDDPDKVVWQSAAWAFRQLGNRGHGVDMVKAALASPTAETRRGAARVFAYQFYGMDGRVDILQAFIKLLSDPDLLTRHQAVQSLAQWWYRTTDREIRGAIVQAFIDRLANPEEHELQRFNLSQGLYNLLDENVGVPGTGYGRWISYLKPEHQEALRSERRWQEQEILLKPILNALINGGPPQRLGVLLGFDGTPFWRGYTTAAFGPGNDRAFDFERKQFYGLEEAFATALSRKDQPLEMSYGLRLAAFFDVFRGNAAPKLAPLYLDSLLHRDAPVRQAASEIADRVSLKGTPDSEMVKLVEAASSPARTANSEARTAAVKLLRSHSSLLENQRLRDFVRSALEDRSLSSLTLPLVASATFSDDEAQAALLRAWPTSLPDDTQPPAAFTELQERNSLLSREVLERTRRDQRAQAPQALLDCVSLLDKRPGLIEQPAVLQRLAFAATAGNGQIRQVVFELLAKHPQSAGNQALISLIRAALTDGRAEVRRAALNAVGLNSAIWRSPAVYQQLAQLLVDADSQVRKAALELVARERLIAQEPRLAGRVKALELAERDSGMRLKAADALRNAGLEPAAVSPTADLTKPAVPDFESFRRNINSYFYQESVKDRRACANCHATHRIFRLAEPPASGAELGESSLEMNYRSLLRVIDVYEPESSLVLRKPLSPSGQGDEDSSSPTGLTHVGGPRWMGRNDPAYQAILLWVRAATATTKASNTR